MNIINDNNGNDNDDANDNENNNENVINNENQNRNNKFISYLHNNNSTDYIISQKNKTDKINNEYQSANKLNIVKEDKSRRKENDDSEPIDINMENPKFNFLDYLYYIIKCGKTKKNIKIYNKFREKILSEEYFVHNNLNMKILLNLNENNLINNKNMYLLTNMVNIV